MTIVRTSLGTMESARRLRFEPGGTISATDVQEAIEETGSEKVAGPGSATDNAISRFDGTTGKVLQTSGVVVDDSDNVSGVGSLTLGTPLARSSGGTGQTTVPPAFAATKGGVDQTGIADATFTAVTFGTEVYDVGGFFASNAWTPPAGKISIKAAVYVTGTITAGSTVAIAIYKNGAALRQGTWFSGTDQGSAIIVIDDIANGTDAYSVQAYVDVSSGTATISGATNGTYFMGHWISE